MFECLQWGDWLDFLATRTRGRQRTRYRRRRLETGSTVEPLEGRLLLAASITELGVLPGWSASVPSDINNEGQIVGELQSGGPYGITHAFLDSGGVMTDLGVLPGGESSSAIGINDQGQVVGSTYYLPQQTYHTFVYSNGNMTDLGVLPGWSVTFPAGINNKGQVAGFLGGTRNDRAFLWSAGVMSVLTSLPGEIFSRANALNDQGEVVGQSGSVSTHHAVLYSGASVIDLNADLKPGEDNSYAYDINKGGQVVGISNGGAFLWTPTTPNGTTGSVTYLPQFGPPDVTLGSPKINDAGQIIGVATNLSTFNRPFLYINGQMIDPNSLLPPGSGWTIRILSGINDRGQIVGTGLHNGTASSFVLTLDSGLNVAPTVSVGQDGSVFTSQDFARLGSFTDPNITDSWTATVDYGDGTGIQPLVLNPDQTFALSHWYFRPGQFHVMVTVLDQRGGVGTSSLTVTVNPPVSGFGPGRDAFVTSLYTQQLDRWPEPQGLRYWARGLATGWTPWTVAEAIWKSSEHRARQRQHLSPIRGLWHSYHVALRAGHSAAGPHHSQPAGPMSLFQHGQPRLISPPHRKASWELTGAA
jgi:probable HAF family extracellular repeat protein